MLPDANRELFESSCAGKECFSSEESAVIVERMMKQGKIRKVLNERYNPMRAYRCPFSEPGKPHWHLGH
jgi:hypothetical protein